MLPKIKVSERAANHLTLLKGRTGLDRNIISRMAIMLALKEESNLVHKPDDLNHLPLTPAVLFGDYSRLYEALLVNYQINYEPDLPMNRLIPSLIESGLQSLRHVKKLDELIEHCIK